MKKNKTYSEGEIGEVEAVRDFLPRPEDLVLKDDTVKVTINLSRSSLEFFKKIAKKNGSKYQKVIRNLLDSYSGHYREKQNE